MCERIPAVNAENAGEVAQLCVYRREEDGIFCLQLSFHFPLFFFPREANLNISSLYIRFIHLTWISFLCSNFHLHFCALLKLFIFFF